MTPQLSPLKASPGARPAPAYSWAALLEILRCPFCGGEVEFRAVRQSFDHARECGILACGCRQHPVLDGIPIFLEGHIGVFDHTQGDVQYRGPRVEEVLDLVARGRGLQALLRCIAVPNRPVKLEHIRPRRLWRLRWVMRVMARLRRAQMARQWGAMAATYKAEDWMWAFFGSASSLEGDLFSYFFYRFAQPRHLATLALAHAWGEPEKPLLDLACGFGHLGHNLAQAYGHRVVGADRNFLQIWAAQYGVAPQNRFVCADADRRLPFAGNVFGGVLCSDAFHYFRDKAGALAEMERSAGEAPVVLARVGNRSVTPNEGFELTPEEYLALTPGRSWAIYGETELLEAYLEQRAPRADAQDAGRLSSEKWLYLVQGARAWRNSAAAAGWVHGAGHLAVNPIYDVRLDRDGSAHLEFRFPTPHYARENGAMHAYHPERITIDAETRLAIAANQRTPRVEELIAQRVVLGLPERYTRSSI